MTVNVLSDGYVEANQVVPGGGTVTFTTATGVPTAITLTIIAVVVATIAIANRATATPAMFS